MPHPTDFNYIGFQSSTEDASLIPSRGGIVRQFNSGGALNIGDTVYLSAAGVASKATTAHTGVLGVVVGGTLLPNYIVEYGNGNAAALIAAGIAATSVAGQLVYVMMLGITYAICDGVIAAGALLKESATTAGQVTTATASTDSGTIVGKLIDAAAAVAGDVRLILVSLM